MYVYMFKSSLDEKVENMIEKESSENLGLFSSSFFFLFFQLKGSSLKLLRMSHNIEMDSISLGCKANSTDFGLLDHKYILIF